QGQSFFQASGDFDAYTNMIFEPVDDPNITVVGGTVLTTTGPAGARTGESVWNVGGSVGSRGGISLFVPIPYWQQGVDMSANHGSTLFRNLPDVALTGFNVAVAVGGGVGTYGGTSL